MRKELVEENGDFRDTGSLKMDISGRLPSELPLKSKKTEELKIDGKAITCQVKTYVRDEEGTKIQITVWESDEAKIPYRVLDALGPKIALLPNVVRLNVEYDHEGDSGKITLDVTSLKQPMKVGSQKIDCVVEKGTFNEKNKQSATVASVERWLSSEIPGHEAKVIVKGTLNDRPIALEKTVVDFKK